MTCGRLDEAFNIIFDIVLRDPYAADGLAHKHGQPRCVTQEDTDKSRNDDSDH